MKTSKKSKSPNGSSSKMSPIAETQEKTTTLTDTPEEMRKVDRLSTTVNSIF